MTFETAQDTEPTQACFAFSDLLEAAQGQELFVSGKDRPPTEDGSMAWLAKMASTGEDLEVVAPVWLCECCSRSDGYAELATLACAVNSGLPKVAAALIQAGADPSFKFKTCIPLVVSAMEAAQMSRSTGALGFDRVEGRKFQKDCDRKAF